MRNSDVFPAWGRILRGGRPFLSLEITKECPLRCPGCYAYDAQHLGGDVGLRQLSDYRGEALVHRVMALVRRYRPLHISIIGGEPLVRYRELQALLPALSRRKIEVQLVTSAVRPIPVAWRHIDDLHIVVSIDGLQPEHDRRRAPATYDRILRHIEGHQLTVHCTITRQMLQTDNAVAEFARFWSLRPEVRKIWFSLYTPQEGDCSEERLTPADRDQAVRDISQARARHPKIHAPDSVLRGFLAPPRSPDDCVFAKVTHCVTADLATKVEPCQFGGRPVCSECGCIASAGLASFGEYRLAGLVRLGDIFEASRRVGRANERLFGNRAVESAGSPGTPA